MSAIRPPKLSTPTVREQRVPDRTEAPSFQAFLWNLAAPGYAPKQDMYKEEKEQG